MMGMSRSRPFEFPFSMATIGLAVVCPTTNLLFTWLPLTGHYDVGLPSWQGVGPWGSGLWPPTNDSSTTQVNT